MKLPIIFQRLEAGLLFLASIYFYHHLHFNFFLFILLLLSFDIFMAGYLVSNKVGAFTYNLGHSLFLPLLVLIIGFAGDNRILIGTSLIWFAHIGFDRALGYGLKFTTDFRDTHLGRIGKKK